MAPAHVPRPAPNDTFVCFVDRLTPKLHELGPNVRPRTVQLRETQTLAASSTGYRSVTDLLRLTQAVNRLHGHVLCAIAAAVDRGGD